MKFKMFSNLYIGFLGKIAGNVLHWYVVRYTLDDSIKHNKILWLIAKFITENLCRFANWLFNKTIEKAPEEFWEYRREYLGKYFN